MKHLMKKSVAILASTAAVTLLATSISSAAIIGVSGGESLLSTGGNSDGTGGLAEIIGAPSEVNNNNVANLHQQGFDEVQGYTLLNDYNVDGGGKIYAGTQVNSHMIFLNQPNQRDSQYSGTQRIEHQNVTWTFNGRILGIMSNKSGSFENASTGELGAPGTNYSTFGNRGFESNDMYTILASGNQLLVNMIVTQPGDWIRVVTAVPLPAALPLYGAGMALLGFIGWRRKQKAAAAAA